MMRAHFGWIATMLVLVLGGPALAQSAAPVAVLTEIKRGGQDGEIRVKLAGKDEWRAPQPLMSLNTGDEIRVKGGAAKATIVFTGGATQSITKANSPFKISPQASAGTGRQVAGIFGGMAQFLMGKEKEPVYTQLSTRSLQKDAEPQLVILAPRETRLLPTQVKFAWTGGPDAGKYTVRVFGPKGVQWTGENLPQQAVNYPDSAPKLQAGVQYRWEVRMPDALPERAQFEIVTDQEWSRIKGQLAEIKAGGSATTATLARVAVLFQERLYQSALEELQTAIAADKTEPNLQFMLGHVYDRMGLREQAASAFDIAQKLSTD